MEFRAGSTTNWMEFMISLEYKRKHSMSRLDDFQKEIAAAYELQIFMKVEMLASWKEEK